MAYVTSWVIGSTRDVDIDVTVDGSLENIAGSRYLYSASSGLSLLAGMATAMANAGVIAPAAVLTRDRRVRLISDAAFTVAWGSNTSLRDWLGFTGDLAGAAVYTAPSVSTLLWSPAKPLSPELSPIGTRGVRRPLAYYTQSPSDGSTFVVQHGHRIDQRWSCTLVAMSRVQTADDAGGEWAVFFDEVVARGASFYVYREVTEDPGSTTTVVLSGGLGPYVWSPGGRAPSWDLRRTRGFELIDRRADITIPCRDAPEY